MSHRVRYVALLFWRLLASLGDADTIQIGHLVGWHCPQARDAAREGEAAQVAQVERLTRELEEAQQAALGPEPPAGPDVTSVAVRMPDGRRIKRQFAKSAPLRFVRHWVEAFSAPDAPMLNFELRSQFPRYVASAANQEVTIEEAGLLNAALVVGEVDVEVQ